MALKYKHTILLVDDEKAITNALQRLFRKEGYNILAASSGKEGLELIDEVKKPVSLIISDQRMPEMNGSEFLEKARKIFPEAIRFLLTGYSDMDAIVDAVNKGEIHRYLTKPWNDDDLLLQVRQSLEQFELVVENRRLMALTKRQNKELNELNENLEQKVEERSREIIVKNKELGRLNKDLESSLYNTVRAFASLTEMHSSILAGHGRRVSRMSQELAALLELPEKEVVHIEIAALLHDTGKLGLPKKLMEYKENSWTPKEVALFQKHSEEGQTIVRFINKLDHVGILIRSHHERFDGQGYPDQLSEEAIPIGARIIAVADAYDKIVDLKVKAKSLINAYSKDRRVTQDHLTEDELLQQAAVHHLKQDAFTRFDPDVVKAMLEVIKSRGYQEGKEKAVPAEDLKAGMVLSRSLYTSKGRFLLPYNTRLTEEYIDRLKAIYKQEAIGDSIYVTGA